MPLATIGQLWKLARKVEDLFELQVKTRESFERVSERLADLERRMTELEAGQRQLITEAKAAATGSAAMVAGGVVSDAVTRITRLEGRMVELTESRRLAPPSDETKSDA